MVRRGRRAARGIRAAGGPAASAWPRAGGAGSAVRVRGRADRIATGSESPEERAGLARAPRRRRRPRTRRARAGRPRTSPRNARPGPARPIRATVASWPPEGSPYPRGPKSDWARMRLATCAGWSSSPRICARSTPRSRSISSSLKRGSVATSWSSESRRRQCRASPQALSSPYSWSAPPSMAPPASSAALATSTALRARVPLRSTRPSRAVTPFSSGASSADPPRDRSVSATTGAPRFSRTSTVRPLGRTSRVTGPSPAATGRLASGRSPGSRFGTPALGWPSAAVTRPLPGSRRR